MELRETFLKPQDPYHRRYEALRARYVGGMDSRAAAEAFGYSLGSFRNLCSAYRANPGWEFFQPPRKPPEEPAPGAGHARKRRNARILELRSAKMSIHRIADALAAEGCTASLSTIAKVIRDAGLPRLPRRSAAVLADIAGPDAAPVADRRAFRLEEGTFRTRFGGLFVFAPMLAELDLEGLLAGMPDGDRIPAGCAWRALLALKLWGIGRPSQAMSEIFDPGLALFAGLNAMPKRSTLTEYSTRVDPRRFPALMHDWNRAIRSHGLVAGASFDLDFHTIPYHGDQALIEKYYVSKRSRRQNGILAFLARDAEARVFCYADATIRKGARNDAILRFVEDYREETGVLPAELVFDSHLTTRANLARLDQMKIRFLTLRRRSGKMMPELCARPDSDWRRIRLENIGRRYRQPRIIDSRIHLPGYPGDIRQIAVTDLGHVDPVLLITNQMQATPSELVDRYARRMVIENQIAETIDFFHMDALSAAIPMRINTDLQLTLMASGLYRILANRIENGQQAARARTLFRNFIDATANVTVSKHAIRVRFGRRASNSMLVKAGFADTETRIPWLENRPLSLHFGN